MPISTPALPQRLEPRSGVLASAPARVRAEWVDVAKGVGIVLVVFGHAVDGLLNAGLAAAGSGWALAHYLVYTFHMPLFFVLTGLFVQRRLAEGAGGFARTTLVRIAWPYLLWSVVQWLVIGALGNAVNLPLDPGPWSLLSLAWTPISQFWFLLCLFELQLLALCIVPRFGAAALLLVLLLARGVSEWVELPLLLRFPARFGLFYAIGLMAGPALLGAVHTLSRQRATRLAAVAGSTWALAATAALAAGVAYTSLGALPAALAGSAAVIVLSTLPRGGLAGFWIRLGRASMAIFVLHVLFVAGVRIVMHRLLGVDAVLAILLPACVAGIAGPMLVRALALRLGASRALGLG